MTYRELAQPLRGIIPPLVAPLSDDGRLDEAALERLVEHVLAGGVHGLFLLGTCGEGPSLNTASRRQLVERAVRQADGRVPVVVNVTDTSLAETLAAAHHAADAGADAVALAPPYYYPIDQAALVAHVLRIVSEMPLPLVLYNMPLTKMAFEPESVRRLIDEEKIVGLKDSSGDIDYFQSIHRLTTAECDWSLLVGPERLLARALALDGDGGVCGGANVWPQLFVQIYDASLVDDQPTVERLMTQVNELGRIYQVGRDDDSVTAPSVIQGLKSALSVLGLCNATVAPPLASHTPAQCDQVAEILHALGLERTVATP